jgi:hypothetical protein
MQGVQKSSCREGGQSTERTPVGWGLPASRPAVLAARLHGPGSQGPPPGPPGLLDEDRVDEDGLNQLPGWWLSVWAPGAAKPAGID